MEVLWQVLRTFFEGVTLLNGSRSMYGDILACVRSEGGGMNEFSVF